MTPTPPTAPHRRLRWRAALVALAAAAPVVALAAAPGTASASTPAPDPGWTTVWSDDFTGAANTAPSGTNWLYDVGTSYPGGAANWGTGEVETMTNSTANVYLDGSGNLAIKPIRDASGHWTSGRIETQRNDFQPPAGGVLRVQASLKLPAVSGAGAQGYWPAFWMLGGPFRGNYTNWPSVGEMDIMEAVNADTTVHGTFHCGVSPGGPCNETSGLSGSYTPAADPHTSFHTYRIEWDRSISPQQLRWYVDGVQYWSVSQNQVDATTWANATNHGYMVILNVAMGGGWPGSPTSATVSGQPMLVDYVAVYSKSGGTTTTPPPTGNRDAYSPIQAESYDAQSGTQTETTSDTGGGSDVGWIANGDWLQYKGVNFGSTAARQFYARVASGAASGVSGLVEVRLDSRSNAPIGSFAVGNTGGWQSWQTIPANISGVTGTHDVFLTFSSGQPADYLNINWFDFGH